MQLLRDIQIGDTVILESRGARNPSMREAKVSGVGRKYFFVEHSPRPFCRETGTIHSGYGEVIAYTVEAYKLKERARIALRELRNFGLEFTERPYDEAKIVAVRAALNDLMPPVVRRTETSDFC